MTDTTLPVPLPPHAQNIPLLWKQYAEEYARACMAPLQENNAKLKTVMIAAAEEIAAHWAGHCDAEGYGPVNLLHRLEEGIPSEYGYTAGAFKALQERADALQTELNSIADTLPGVHYMDPPDGGAPTLVEQFKRMAKDAKRADALQAELAEVKGHYQRAGEHYAELEGRADALEAALKEADALMHTAIWAAGKLDVEMNMRHTISPRAELEALTNQRDAMYAWRKSARSLINPTGGESS